MPIPTNPKKREFYVYQFKVNGHPFYVGIGRDKRGSDRLRYVRSLMVAKNAAKLAKQSLSIRVMAALLRLKAPVRFSCTRRPMNRFEALEIERKTILRLVRAGGFLTNWQHNPLRHKNAAKALRAVLAGSRSRKVR